MKLSVRYREMFLTPPDSSVHRSHLTKYCQFLLVWVAVKHPAVPLVYVTPPHENRVFFFTQAPPPAAG